MLDDYAALEKSLNDNEVLMQAKARYTQTDSYQARLKSKYTRLHHFYDPLNGDQWPEDVTMRPGKIHMTSNVVKPAVDIDSRLQSLLPRIANVPDGADEASLRSAEVDETLLMRFLELSGWDVWMSIFCQVRSLYGKGILKPIWNKDDGRPDVIVVENPANLRIGWGSSDYTVKDWGLYEYALSPFEVMRRWPDIVVQPQKGKGKSLLVARTADHTDPLAQKLPPQASSGTVNNLRNRPTPYQPSDYEDKQVDIWDYWYKDLNGTVYNCIVVGQSILAEGPTEHSEYPDIPYIIAENDHVPGNPEGVSAAEPILDLQIEMNRAISHWSQLVADELDPSYQLTGDNADSVSAGMIPRAGEVVAAGSGNEIKPIPKGVNQFPLQQLMAEYWNQFHKITGMSEILYGTTPSADISGRALAVQIEAAINRLDPRRRRLYAALRELLMFWVYMVKKVNPTIDASAKADGAAEPVKVGDILGKTQRWKIVAPELTPRDLIEATTNVANQVNSKMLSLRTGMDRLGIDSPEKELDLIRTERADAHLFPGDVLQYVSVVGSLQQLQQAQAAEQAQQGASPQDAQGQGMAQDQTAQPAGIQGDNGSNPAAPDNNVGGYPPIPGAGPMLGKTLIRAQPNGQAKTLSQIGLQQRLG